MTLLERVLSCIECGRETADWWYADFGRSVCRCNSCYAKQRPEAKEEKDHQGLAGGIDRSIWINHILEGSQKLAEWNNEKRRDTAPRNFAPEPPARMEDGSGREALSTVHISPRKGQSRVEYRAGASVLKVHRRKKAEKDQLGTMASLKHPKKESKRGKAGFSRKSRSGLMRTLASVRRDKLPLFVTLTFPKDYPTVERAKRDLDTLIKRLARKFPNVAGVWKLEPQERGAPHFHLLIWGVSRAELSCFVPLAWYEIVGSGDPNHLAWHEGNLGNKHCVQPIEKQSGVFWYASKYMSKEVQENYSNWGRWWGVFFRERLPMGELVAVEVTEEKAIEFIRYMRRFAHIKSRDYPALTIICNAETWVNRLL